MRGEQQSLRGSPSTALRAGSATEAIPWRSSSILISRCICKATPFAELLGPAREHGWSLSDLVRETGCGGQCGLCRPYISRMLRTGETEFHEIITEDTL